MCIVILTNLLQSLSDCRQSVTFRYIPLHCLHSATQFTFRYTVDIPLHCLHSATLFTFRYTVYIPLHCFTPVPHRRHIILYWDVCCAVLRWAALHCTGLRCAVPCRAAPYHAICTVQYGTVLQCIVLYCTALWS